MKIEIRPVKIAKTSSGKSLKLTIEAIEMIDPINRLGSCNMIKCTGPRLYDFTNDKTLV
jgi:hypothetical protein